MMLYLLIPIYDSVSNYEVEEIILDYTLVFHNTFNVTKHVQVARLSNGRGNQEALVKRDNK